MAEETPTAWSPVPFAPAGCGELWVYNPARRPRKDAERVRDLVVAMVPVLQLADWTIKVRLSKWRGLGECLASPEYRIANIRLNIARIQPHWLPEFVAHELDHCNVETLWALALTWAGKDKEKRELARLAGEELTTKLGQRTVAMLNLTR